jgi:hypothetical protein
VNRYRATLLRILTTVHAALGRWIAEIKIRATMRIGELSKELEKAPSGPGRGKKSLPTTGKPFKTEALKAAGISTSERKACCWFDLPPGTLAPPRTAEELEDEAWCRAHNLPVRW